MYSELWVNSHSLLTKWPGALVRAEKDVCGLRLCIAIQVNN